MTFCFIQAIERGQGSTYGSILNSMRSTIRNTNSGGGGLGNDVVTSLIGMLSTGGSVSGGLRQVFAHLAHLHLMSSYEVKSSLKPQISPFSWHKFICQVLYQLIYYLLLLIQSNPFRSLSSYYQPMPFSLLATGATINFLPAIWCVYKTFLPVNVCRTDWSQQYIYFIRYLCVLGMEPFWQKLNMLNIFYCL